MMTTHSSSTSLLRRAHTFASLALAMSAIFLTSSPAGAQQTFDIGVWTEGTEGTSGNTASTCDPATATCGAAVSTTGSVAPTGTPSDATSIACNVTVASTAAAEGIACDFRRFADNSGTVTTYDPANGAICKATFQFEGTVDPADTDGAATLGLGLEQGGNLVYASPVEKYATTAGVTTPVAGTSGTAQWFQSNTVTYRGPDLAGVDFAAGAAPIYLRILHREQAPAADSTTENAQYDNLVITFSNNDTDSDGYCDDEDNKANADPCEADAQCTSGFCQETTTAGVTSKACAAPVCGNDVVEGPEACDDGDMKAGNGCSADCTFVDNKDVDADCSANGNAECASGFCKTEGTSPNETMTCAEPVCGNGATEGPEGCDGAPAGTDPAMPTDTTACTTECTLKNGQTCTSDSECASQFCKEGATATDPKTCEDAVCGNGATEGPEGCDGAAPNTSPAIPLETPECTVTCKLKNDQTCTSASVCDSGYCSEAGKCAPEPMCGNSMVEDGEACDDGNADEDTCTMGCKLAKDQACTENAQCASGNCDTSVTPNVCGSDPVCGDGEKEGSEACDDGDTVPGNGCNADCTFVDNKADGADCTDGGDAACASGFCDADKKCAVPDNTGIGITLGGGKTCSASSNSNAPLFALMLVMLLGVARFGYSRRNVATRS